MINEKNDDDVVSLYIQLSDCLLHLSTEEHIKLAKWIEQEYILEADSPLGDYLNDLWILYYHHLFDNQEKYNDLHNQIRELVYDSELDYDMLYEVGKMIMENRILNQVY